MYRRHAHPHKHTNKHEHIHIWNMKWGTSHMLTSHATQMEESCYTNGLVMSWVPAVVRSSPRESCHTVKWVTSHNSTRHVIQWRRRVMSHMPQNCVSDSSRHVLHDACNCVCAITRDSPWVISLNVTYPYHSTSHNTFTQRHIWRMGDIWVWLNVTYVTFMCLNVTQEIRRIGDIWRISDTSQVTRLHLPSSLWSWWVTSHNWISHVTHVLVSHVTQCDEVYHTCLVSHMSCITHVLIPVSHLW